MKRSRKILITFVFIVFFGVLFFYNITATPQLALWTGNRCSACHISNQGGGMRSDFGWNFAKESSIFSIHDKGLKAIYSIDKEKYSYFDKLFAWGLDFRYQSTRSNKTDDAVRKYYPMQASLYANTNPWEWLLVEGEYNYGDKIFEGQQEWSASAYIKPGKGLPTIHIGKFEPAMGLYECDMTMLDRRNAVPDGTEQFIPPDYAEAGAELIYESLDWLSLNAGVFDSWNLGKQTVWGNDLQYVTVPHNPSFVFKAMFFPEWYFDDFASSFIGAALLINGRFAYYNAFAGYSLIENLSIEARYYGSYLSGNVDAANNVKVTNSIIGQINYIPYRGIILTARAEKGNANLTIDDTYTQYDFDTYQYIFSATLQPLPYVELIAQYRITDCYYYTSGRWMFQAHLYY
jgi:hypothetical protein